MSRSTPEQLKLVGVSNIFARLLLILPVALAAFGSWQAGSWYAGSEVALIAPQMLEGGKSAAEDAVRLAPADPLAHHALATLEQRDVASDKALRAAIAEYEKAVSLSPGDFRLWVDLGRAREQAGLMEEGERALRRGVELAPYYSWPRWNLGNFLVRRGRYDEAFTELKRVAEGDDSKRGYVLDMAWFIFRGDSQAMNRALGDSTELRAQLVSYLLHRERLNEALELWNSLSAAERRNNRAVAQTLMETLMATRRVRTALAVSNDMTDEQSAREVGKVWNGSFESPVVKTGASPFDWQVMSIPQAQAALDPKGAREGSLSLRINFTAPGALDFNIRQLVAVEPAANYRLTFYVKGNGLKSGAMPVVQILSAGAQAGLAESEPARDGTTDWQQVTVNFKTPPDVDGIIVRISRTPCGAEGAVCPIFGTVWYDDFNLQLVGREAGANRNGSGK